MNVLINFFFFFSSRRRHTRSLRDWSSDVCSSDLPGVFAVFTHRTMPRMNPTPKPWSHLHPHGQSYLPLQDDQIHYAGQPVALVVAGTLDQATYAGTLIRVEYQ